MKKKIVSGLILLITLLALLGTSACNSMGAQEGVSQQKVEVTRGDLTVSVAGSGKIETSREARLTFGSAGKVDEILVAEGYEVKSGDVLAKLDTRSLELAEKQAKLTLTQAEVALVQAQLAHKSAEYNLKSIVDSEDALKLALLNAQINLDTAEYALSVAEETHSWPDIQKAQAEVDKAEAFLQYALDEGLESLVIRAQAELTAAEAIYDAIAQGYDPEEVAIKKKQVEMAEMTLVQAQKDIDDLAEDIAMQELQVTSAAQAIEQAQQSVDLASLSLDEAQRQLDEATIIAPFDGTVAMVLVKEGDIMPSPSMAPQAVVQLIDPGSLELVIEVDEIDIPLVRMGQEAVVTVDALQEVDFQGVISSVYPVPKEEGGVVLYSVRVNLDAPPNTGIKVGMSASAEIVAEKHENVLMVPSRAVDKNDQGETVVRVMENEEIQERVVVVGLDDGLRTEIVSGVEEGETVVYEVRVKSASMSMF
jgi:HlyD family secretion protein